jgi:hypothetical protein
MPRCRSPERRSFRPQAGHPFRRDRKVAAFTSEQVAAFTPERVAALLSESVAGLTSDWVAGLGRNSHRPEASTQKGRLKTE